MPAAARTLTAVGRNPCECHWSWNQVFGLTSYVHGPANTRPRWRSFGNSMDNHAFVEYFAQLSVCVTMYTVMSVVPFYDFGMP